MKIYMGDSRVMTGLIIAFVLFNFSCVNANDINVDKWSDSGNATANTIKWCWAEFYPQKDITAYELALAIVFMGEDTWPQRTEVPDEIKRHFKEVCW